MRDKTNRNQILCSNVSSLTNEINAESKQADITSQANKKLNQAFSLSNCLLSSLRSSQLSFIAYQTWYLEWILPPIVRAIEKLTHVSKTFHQLVILNPLGMLAYITKVFGDMHIIYNALRLTTHTDITGKKKRKRHIDKALFSALDIGLTIPAFVGFFLLQAAWASPFFIAISCGFFAKAVYSLGKNVKKMYTFNDHPLAMKQETNTDTPEAKIYYAQRRRHRAKIYRSLFDVACTGVAVVSTILFCTNPLIGCVGLLLTGLAAYVFRKKLTQKAKKAKKHAIDIFKKNNSKEKADDKSTDYKFFNELDSKVNNKTASNQKKKSMSLIEKYCHR